MNKVKGITVGTYLTKTIKNSKNKVKIILKLLNSKHFDFIFKNRFLIIKKRIKE